MNNSKAVDHELGHLKSSFAVSCLKSSLCVQNPVSILVIRIQRKVNILFPNKNQLCGLNGIDCLCTHNNRHANIHKLNVMPVSIGRVMAAGGGESDTRTWTLEYIDRVQMMMLTIMTTLCQAIQFSLCQDTPPGIPLHIACILEQNRLFIH